MSYPLTKADAASGTVSAAGDIAGAGVADFLFQTWAARRGSPLLGRNGQDAVWLALLRRAGLREKVVTLGEIAQTLTLPPDDARARLEPYREAGYVEIDAAAELSARVQLSAEGHAAMADYEALVRDLVDRLLTAR